MRRKATVSSQNQRACSEEEELTERSELIVLGQVKAISNLPACRITKWPRLIDIEGKLPKQRAVLDQTEPKSETEMKRSDCATKNRGFVQSSRKHKMPLFKKVATSRGLDHTGDGRRSRKWSGEIRITPDTSSSLHVAERAVTQCKRTKRL